MTSTPKDYVKMMDDFADTMYNTVKPKSDAQPIVIEDMVNVFKELKDWAVKRNEILNSEQSAGGSIGEYQKGINGSGSGIGKGNPGSTVEPIADKQPGSSTKGILEQLGTRTRNKKRPRLPSYSESDGSDSGGAGTEQPPIPVNGRGILAGSNGDNGSDNAKIDSGGAVQ